MKATFKLLFFVQKTKMKADGTAPILARVTVNGDMVTFSTQKSVKPDRWDSKAQRTPGRNQEEKDINSALRILSQLFASPACLSFCYSSFHSVRSL